MTGYFDGEFEDGMPDDGDGGGGDNPCGECGFDHDMEVEEAREWHAQNPCSYCIYEFGIGHGPSCPTQFEGDGDD
jgi:hypothetical protein